jgi:putative tryptophan/tyrosine transport system substrate-binding protein
MSKYQKCAVCLATVVMLMLCGARTEAQQPAGKITRIGFLSTGSRGGRTANVEVLRQSLRELGYVEGKDILIEYRYAEGQMERLPALVEELTRLKIDILIASSATVARAAKKSNVTIPIVAANIGNLKGIVDSLARPGGNVTGLTHVSIELIGKRLELLKAVVPKVSRFAFLDDGASEGYKNFAQETQRTAQTLGVELHRIEVRRPDPEIENVFQTLLKERIGGFIIEATPRITFYRQKILSLAEQHRLPAIHSDDSWANAGGLMSYGANRVEPYRRVAVYIDKIVKGAKPAELPVEQPTKFDLVINLKAAKQIGVTVPQSMLARADKVIK